MVLSKTIDPPLSALLIVMFLFPERSLRAWISDGVILGAMALDVRSGVWWGVVRDVVNALI